MNNNKENTFCDESGNIFNYLNNSLHGLFRLHGFWSQEISICKM